MRQRAFALAGTMVIFTGGIALAQMTPNGRRPGPIPVPAEDARQSIPVTPETRIFVLAEMHKMLSAARRVAESVGKRDSKAAADAARTSGLKAFQGMPKEIMMVLPLDFRALGRQSHMSFDALAEAADSGADATVISAKLGKAMQYCVACHETYRFTSKN